ncbi:MAG: RluA family pseudouridine synthase [Desulfoprunum sp.]|uniref:RluA family pseudouridine synthase n=1 Tax=Desulfoprunum sp. TaxID=2020866 RepID=UPI003C728B65
MSLSTVQSPRSQEEADPISITVDDRMVGIRLDHFLVQTIPDHSRSTLVASIRSGSLKVNDRERKSSYRLKEGDRVHGLIRTEASDLQVEPEKIPLQILFEDQYLLALSKPPGLVVHPGSGNRSGTLVNGLVYYCRAIALVGDNARPGIVHRLDKDTSGLMLVAKDERVLRLLATDFKERRVDKEYLAIVHGILPEKSGRIVAAIGRHPVNRQKMAVVEGSGRHAVTNWRVLREAAGRFTLLAVTIETGRTHQIRVHMSHIGHPVAGDPVYGGRPGDPRFPRQMLHAARLRFVHPVTRNPLDIVAPIWPDFVEALRQIFGDIPMEIEGMV